MGNQASNQVSDEAIDITPITSSQLLKGIKGKVQTFSTISRLQNAVEALSKKLKKGTITNQYLVFQHVTEDNFAEFEEKRDKMSRAIRVTHCEDIDTLIIKVLTRAQETVINLFNLRFSNKISRTEVLSSAMFCIKECMGPSAKKKPGGCGMPIPARLNEEAWPTLVLETGLSESLPQLRMDTRWWLANSQGQVKIVILIAIDRAVKNIHLEKWECRPRRYNTRSRPNATHEPTQIQTIDIDANSVVTGTPPATTPSLVLGFQDLFLRHPIWQEQDVIFSEDELRNYARDIWANLDSPADTSY